MDGFEVIYSKYSPLVFRYLLSLGVDFLSAEELTAETFYRAYINFDKYKGESKIETWLCAIAKNEYRKDCKRREKATATEEMERAADQTDLVDRLLDNRSLNHGRRDSKLSRRSDFQRAWSFSCVMVLHAEAVSANILHGKAVRFFGI